MGRYDMNLIKCDNPNLVVKALRSHADMLCDKINKLPPNASDEYFCSLAYEELDCRELANDIERRDNTGLPTT